MRVKNPINLFNLVISGVMTALSCAIIVFFPEVQIFFHLKITICDFPQILVGLICGPLWGIASTFLRCVFQALWGASSSFGIGEFINFVLCSCMILSMHFLCKKLFRDENLNRPEFYYVSAAVTIILTIAVGYLLNMALLPLFFYLMGNGFSSDAYWTFVFASTTVNALKSSVNILPLYPAAYVVLRYINRYGRRNAI